MQNMQKCWEGLLQSYWSYFAYICTPVFADVATSNSTVGHRDGHGPTVTGSVPSVQPTQASLSVSAESRCRD